MSVSVCVCPAEGGRCLCSSGAVVWSRSVDHCRSLLDQEQIVRTSHRLSRSVSVCLSLTLSVRPSVTDSKVKMRSYKMIYIVDVRNVTG